MSRASIVMVDAMPVPTPVAVSMAFTNVARPSRRRVARTPQRTAVAPTEPMRQRKLVAAGMSGAIAISSARRPKNADRPAARSAWFGAGAGMLRERVPPAAQDDGSQPREAVGV